MGFDAIVGGGGEDVDMKPGGAAAAAAGVVEEEVLPNRPRISSIVDCWDFGGGLAVPTVEPEVEAEEPEDPKMSARRS